MTECKDGHEWEWTDEHNTEKPAYDYFVIKCKHCPAMKRFHETIQMLNELAQLEADLVECKEGRANVHRYCEIIEAENKRLKVLKEKP